MTDPTPTPDNAEQVTFARARAQWLANDAIEPPKREVVAQTMTDLIDTLEAVTEMLAGAYAVSDVLRAKLEGIETLIRHAKASGGNMIIIDALERVIA